MAEEKDERRDAGLPSVEVESELLGKTRRLIQSEAIFCGQTSALIAHGGEVYTLRVTKQGKLVLNK
ncbi:hemin uptake protein HemP [Rhodoligotrophos defluvii]|uniref:hemin uptake protein HemP n=1 Tax=Rhodoligotrophos defluvii TaxID=2561934 RepID=UPI0010C9479D|nr:hemin uptake protein HemP [Rhodoligotrophos defluvii]